MEMSSLGSIWFKQRVPPSEIRDDYGCQPSTLAVSCCFRRHMRTTPSSAPAANETSVTISRTERRLWRSAEKVQSKKVDHANSGVHQNRTGIVWWGTTSMDIYHRLIYFDVKDEIELDWLCFILFPQNGSSSTSLYLLQAGVRKPALHIELPTNFVFLDHLWATIFRLVGGAAKNIQELGDGTLQISTNPSMKVMLREFAKDLCRIRSSGSIWQIDSLFFQNW